MPVKQAETSSWRREVRVGAEGGGAGVVVFLDRGIVSPWKGVVAVKAVVASSRPRGYRQAQQGNQKEPARVRVNAASGYSRLSSRDESACFLKTFCT